MEIKGSTFKRTRTLRSGEHKQLFDTCKECRGVNKYYAPVVIAFAIATGMRLQEIFSLKWIDIDKKARTITIRESKTDKKQDIPGRVIVLPLIVEHWLNQLSKSSLEQIKHIYEIKDKLGSFATKDMEHLLAFQAFIETKSYFP
jgi:integrase